MCLLPIAVPHSCWCRSDAESSCWFKKTRKWGICYSDMPIAGIYDASSSALGPENAGIHRASLPASAFELIRKGNAFAKKKEGENSRLGGFSSLLNHRGEESWLFASPFL